MNAQLSPSTSTDVEGIRRRAAHEVYSRLAFASFAIWTAGCLILFILFAANSPRPVFPAMFSMTAPLVPAFLVWALYWPLVRRRTARELQHQLRDRP
jgi:hypothetical protein